MKKEIIELIEQAEARCGSMIQLRIYSDMSGSININDTQQGEFGSEEELIKLLKRIK